MTILDPPDLTDDADADDDTGVMIALLPTSDDWCKIDLPHLTLVYAGTTDKLTVVDFNNLAKDAAMLASLSTPIYLRVIGLSVLGDQEKVNVLSLQPTPELWAMRRAVEDWNASQFPFTPHCTIGPIDDGIPNVVPNMVGFNRLFVAYGEENLIFNMKASSY